MQYKYDLAILIPARNEEFLRNTIDDLLKNIRGKTQIIVGLDGNWALPEIKDNNLVTIFYVSESIGQRAITKQCARLAQSKFVMKVDAHCTFDEGFDVKMLEAFKGTEDNVVMVPIMKNLWAFDWKCYHCGWKKYQGPKPEKCEQCKKTDRIKRKMVWVAKKSPQSVSYCFDSEPHFQYFKEYAKRPEYKKDLEETGLTETMSLQGSAWMMTKDKYFDLDVDDEFFGSWGSQGLCIAIKFWLSGGRVLVNHNTWYAHLFRTQGKDFGFPYIQPGRQVQNAKKKARDLFFNNKWEFQTKPLSWLLEKFWPVQGWTEKELEEQKNREKNHPKFGVNAKKETYFRKIEMQRTVCDKWKGDDVGYKVLYDWVRRHKKSPEKCEFCDSTNTLNWANKSHEYKRDLGDWLFLCKKCHYKYDNLSRSIIYYTDNCLNLKIAKAVQNQLRTIGLPIVSASLKPMPHFGKNVHLPLKRGVLTMFKQILAALEASDADIIFHCEADCLYPKEHFEFTPPKKDVCYYNLNVIKIDANDGKTLKVDVCRQVSGLCAYRELLLEEYRKRVEIVEKIGYHRGMGYEPGTKSIRRGGFSDTEKEDWRSDVPIIDIRHDNNLTRNRFKKEQFRNQENTIGWTEGNYKDINGWDLNIIEKVLKK